MKIFNLNQVKKAKNLKNHNKLEEYIISILFK